MAAPEFFRESPETDEENRDSNQGQSAGSSKECPTEDFTHSNEAEASEDSMKNGSTKDLTYSTEESLPRDPSKSHTEELTHPNENELFEDTADGPAEEPAQSNEDELSKAAPKEGLTEESTHRDEDELSKSLSNDDRTEEPRHSNEDESFKTLPQTDSTEGSTHSEEDGLLKAIPKNSPTVELTHSDENELSKSLSNNGLAEELIWSNQKQLSGDPSKNGLIEEFVCPNDGELSRNPLPDGSIVELARSNQEEVSKHPSKTNPSEELSRSNEDELSQGASRNGLIEEIPQSNDDDLSILTLSEAAHKAYPKWSKAQLSASSVPRSTKRTNDGQIKLEDNDSIQLSINEQRILVAQKAAVARFARGKENTSGIQSPVDEPDTRHPHRDEALEPIEETTKETHVPGNELFGQDEIQTPADDRNEDAWMYDVEVNDDDEQINALRRKRQKLIEVQRHSTLSLIEESELRQLDERTANIKRRRHVADQAETVEGGQGLFVDSADEPDEIHNRPQSSQDFADEALTFLKQQDLYRQATPSDQTNATKAKKSRKKAPKNAREVEEQRRVKEEAKAQKKKVRSAVKAASSKKRPSSLDRGKKSVKRPRTEKKKHKSRMRNDRSEISGEGGIDDIINDLQYNDPIADRAAQGELGDAPVIRTTTKKEQFQALIANVGDDYDTHKRKSDHAALRKASCRLGKGQVKAVAGKWLVKGMKTSLYHHQLVAVDWMIGRELAQTPPQGGILADSMGLGKTFQMLATMVGNRPLAEDRRRKCTATLLVLPASAIRQWREEITDHVEKGIFQKIIQYKSVHDLDIEVVMDCDIVLTSYGEVQKSYPHPTDEERLSWESSGGFDAWSIKAREELGVLHKMCWYRVVLDEAHAIKNNCSKTSIACQALKGTFRWALSGTPIHNGVEELFPYFRFLQAGFASSFNEFRTHFCDVKSEDAATRLTIMLSVVMMRRTLKDKIFGRPIVELPKAHPTTVWIDFTEEERILYRILEDRFRDNINTHFAKGTANRSYGAFMVMILRLRQCTSHPFLLEQTIRDIFTDADLQRLKAEHNKCSSNDTPMYEQIQQLIQRPAEGVDAPLAHGGPASSPVPADRSAFGKSDFGKTFQMEKFLSSLNQQDVADHLCGICGDMPTEPQTTECNHRFCKGCSDDYMHRQIALEFFGLACPKCEKVLDSTRAFKPVVDLETDDPDGDGDGDDDDLMGQQAGKKKRKRSNSGNTHMTYEGSHWFDMVAAGKAPMLPSTKLVALKVQILKWLHEAPEDKIIVFCQFRLLAHLVAYVAKQEKWRYVFFLGDMRQQERTAAIRTFHTDKKVPLMITGLKCGGQALNFTCANRVISLDLWWNHSVEQQAFGRVFRIGQQKETHFCRFVIRNSVDVRLLDMQSDKIKVIDRTMQDTGKIPGTLSITQLATLFGHLTEDENGNMHVEADYVERNDGSAEV